MKKHEDMSERELLIRIDERTAHLPALTKKVDKHDIILAVVIVVLLLLTSKSPWIADALARFAG